MEPTRRGFLKGILGTSAGAAGIVLAKSTSIIEPKSNEEKAKAVKRLETLSKDQIIDMMLSNTPIYLGFGSLYQDTMLDAPAEISEERKNLLRGRLECLNRDELIAHAKEFYGLLIKKPAPKKGGS